MIFLIESVYINVKMSSWIYFGFGSANGLAPNMWRAITWSYYGNYFRHHVESLGQNEFT